MPGATKIILVRHAESNVTVSQIVGGELTCTGLSELGVRQAHRLRDRWRHEGATADVVLSSPLPRARQTAEIVAPVLGQPIEFIPDLEEQRPGEADGCPFVEFDERFGMFDFRAEPDRPLAPGGETLREFHERVVACLQRIEVEHSGTTVIVMCHGGVIDAAFRHYLSIDISGKFDLWTLNTSLTEFAVAEAGARPQLRRYNDAAHLAGLPAKTVQPTQ
ncbi:MAG: histidine phosphatase family protein [Acidimicrobiales bacterium]